MSFLREGRVGMGRGERELVSSAPQGSTRLLPSPPPPPCLHLLALLKKSASMP